MKSKYTKSIIFLIIISVVTISIVLSATVLKAAPQQEYTWKNVKIVGGGYVPGIIFNESEKDLVYARTDIGGAYRWNQSTKKWECMTDWIGNDDWSLTGIVSLATDPVDTKRVYLAAGTYTNSWSPINGAILRSADKGKTWERTDLPFKLSGNMPGRGMGERLVIDPNDNKILYLGAPSGKGLWKSVDYGKTWSEVTNFPNKGNFVLDPANEYTADNIGIAWVTFDPKSSSSGTACNTIYVGVADIENSVYRSKDAGKTWARIPGQPTGYLPHHGILGKNGMLYLSYSDSCGPYDGEKGDVWKLDTATDTWTNISPIPSSSSDNYFGYGGLAVDSKNPDTLLVSTLNSWWPDANIYRSTDGGATWKAIWKWGSYPERILQYNHDITASPWLSWGEQVSAPEVRPKLGWMIGDIDIDQFNSDKMMYGTGATIYGTENLTDWDSDKKIDIKVMCEGLEETAVLDLISPPEGASLVSCLGDITGFRHDDLDKVPSLMMTNPNITSTSIDYAEKSPSFMVRVGNKGDKSDVIPIGFSYDGGKNWFQPSSAPNNTEGGTVAANANASCVVWSPKGGNVNLTKDNGSSWQQSTGIPAEAVVESDRVNPDKFYGLSNGTFYVSTDAGKTFVAAAKELGNGKFRAVPGIEGDIWLASTSGIFHSTDSGSTFEKLANVESAECIGYGKAASGSNYMAIYISGTIDGKYGIFRSDDKGASWIRVNDDNHQYAWTGASITGDPRIYGRVYIATNGRGILYGDVSGQVPVVSNSTSATTTSVKPSTTLVTTSAPNTTVKTTIPTTPSPSQTVSAIPSTTSTATTPAASGQFVVEYSSNDWGNGGTASIKITNKGTAIKDGWKLVFDFPGDQKIVNLWCGKYTQEGKTVTISNESWNGQIAPGESVSLGFNMTFTGSNTSPSTFVVN